MPLPTRPVPPPRQLTPRPAQRTPRRGSTDDWSTTPVLLGLGGIIAFAVIVVIAAVRMNASDESVPAGVAAASADVGTFATSDSARRADSVAVTSLALRSGSVPADSLIWADERVHTLGLSIEHAKLHGRAVEAVLDSIPILLRKHTPEAASALASSLHEPLSQRESARADLFRSRAVEAMRTAEAESHVDGVIAQADCKPSRKRVSSLLASHGDWGESIIAAVACRRVQIGMTREQARAAWGAPSHINRTTYSFGVHEQWVYGEYGSGYLYFEDGLLTSVQN
jgi:hypothetical protein